MPNSTESLSRRSLFSNPRAILTALMGVAGATQTLAVPRTSSLNWDNPSYRVLRRMGYGITDFEIAQLNQGGIPGYVGRQLKHKSVSDGSLETIVRIHCPLLRRSVTQLMRMSNDEAMSQQLVAMSMMRPVLSKRQVYERMVEFWLDHFNISLEKVEVAMLIPYVMAVRENAMGSFLTLLKATATSPAMMMYLDNYVNYGTSPNQNYGRELLELHTLGVDGGYSQEDVIQCALCLTGWTIEFDDSKSNFGAFKFDSTAHANGNKQVLGRTITASGRAQGERLLEILATHPSTARNICRKLIRWFVGPAVPPDLLAAASARFLTTNGSITEVLKVILLSPSIAASPPKLKRPFHLFASAARGTGMNKWNVAQMTEGLYDLGHFPFLWGPPNGYPDTTAYWSGGLLARINFGFDLAVDAYQSKIPLNNFRGATALSVSQKLEKRLFAGELASSDQSMIRSIVAENPADDNVIRGGIALGLASPTFQWY